MNPELRSDELKKFSFIFVIVALMLSSACSVIDEVSQSVDYVNEANDFLNTMSEFAENAPTLIESAATDADARNELVDQLNNVENEIEAFNQLDPPTVAEDLHQDLVAKNEELLNQLDQVQQDGELMIEEIENSEIFHTVQDITSLVNAVQKLEL